MGRHTLEGNPPIEVSLRRSGRARRLSLRVSRLDGRVTLSLPTRTPDHEGIAFLRAQEPWLRKHLSQLGACAPVRVGGAVLLRGQLVPIGAADVPRIVVTDSGITVPLRVQAIGVPVQAKLKVMARDALALASDAYAAQVGRSYTQLSIRDTRSRWGSCSSQGRLMYSWRLIMAPPEVLTYVAAHEVAHLVRMNHSDAFWRVVERLYPNYDVPRQWLRENGDQLHRYRFDD